MSTISIPQDSPAEAAYNKAHALRESHIGVERSLKSTRSLFRCVSLFTGLTAILLVMKALLLCSSSAIYISDDYGFPRVIRGLLPVTPLSCGLVAAALFLIYWLLGVAVDELQPGHGKPYTRRLALGLLFIIAVAFVFPLGMLFCVNPARHLLSSRSATVLAFDYPKSVELTPDISARESTKPDIVNEVGVALVILVGLSFAALVYFSIVR